MTTTPTTSKTVPLSRPLQTHKGPLKEIVLNEPTLRAFRQYGEPFKVISTKEGQSIEHDNRALAQFAAHMSGHDEIVLDDLPAKDWYAVRAAVVEMLLGVAGENPIVT